MDLELLNSIIKQVKDDINRVNEYKGIEFIINGLSDEELEYFFNGCGQDLFLNITLSYIIIETKPNQLLKFINDFSNKYMNLADHKMEETKRMYENKQISYEKLQENIKLFKESKNKLLRFQMIYETEINKHLKK